MPEGQYTGSRKSYTYTSDDGQKYRLVLDSTLAEVAGVNLPPSTQTDGGFPKPIRFKPRGVYWQGELDGTTRRKFLVCNLPSTLYGASISTELTIDGVAGKTTGRRGEKLSFPPLETSI